MFVGDPLGDEKSLLSSKPEGSEWYE